MTGELICAWCGTAFEPRSARGPLPRYCRRACRQRAYEQRHARPPLPAPTRGRADEALDVLASAAAAATANAPAARNDQLHGLLDTLVAAAERALVAAGRTPVVPAGTVTPSRTTTARTTRAASRAVAPAADSAWDAAPEGAVVYRRRRDDEGAWVIERWDHSADGWLSRPLDERAGGPSPWTIEGHRSLVRALLSDVLDIARHGATLPIGGADGLLDQVADQLLPADDTDFDLPRDRIEQAVAASWDAVTAWLRIDAHGHHHQWRLVETRRADDGTPIVAPSSRSYDRLHDAKQALRRMRSELTRDHPDRKARGDRFDLEELPGAGPLVATPPPGAR